MKIDEFIKSFDEDEDDERGDVRKRLSRESLYKELEELKSWEESDEDMDDSLDYDVGEHKDGGGLPDPLDEDIDDLTDEILDKIVLEIDSKIDEEPKRVEEYKENTEDLGKKIKLLGVIVGSIMFVIVFAIVISKVFGGAKNNIETPSTSKLGNKSFSIGEEMFSDVITVEDKYSILEYNRLQCMISGELKNFGKVLSMPVEIVDFNKIQIGDKIKIRYQVIDIGGEMFLCHVYLID